MHDSFIEITLQHECSLVNLLHILRIHFHRNTPGGLFPVKTIYSRRCLLIFNWVVIAQKRPHLLLVLKNKNVLETRLPQRFADFNIVRIWFENSPHFIAQVAFCFLTLQKINKKDCREWGKELRFIAWRINLEKRTIAFVIYMCLSS